MTNLRQITLKDFSGGLNTSADKTRVKPNQTPDLLNVSVLDSGAIVRRDGKQQYRQVGTGTIDFLDRYITGGAEHLITHELTTGDVAATPLSVSDEPPMTVTAKSLNPTLPSQAGVYFTSGEAVKVTEATTIAVPAKPSLTIYGAGNEYSVVNGADTVVSVNGVASLGETTGAVTVTPVALPNQSVRITTSSAAPGWAERFRDDFERADGTAGNGWSAISAGMPTTAGIVSGELTIANTSGANYRVLRPTDIGFARGVEAKYISGAGSFTLYVGSRAENAVPSGDWQFRGYSANISSGVVSIQKGFVSYSTTLQNASRTRSAGDVYRLTHSGSTLTLYVNDEPVLTATDSTYMSESDTETYGVGVFLTCDNGSVAIDDFAVYELVGPLTTGTLSSTTTATVPNTTTAKRIAIWQKVTSGAPNQLAPLPGNGYVGLYNGSAPNNNLRFRLIYGVTNRTATTATVTLTVETFVASGTFSESLRGYGSIKGSAIDTVAINSAPNVLNVGETLSDTFTANVTGLAGTATTIQARFYARKNPYTTAQEVIDRTVNLVIPAMTTHALESSTTICGYRLNYLRSASGSLVRAYDPSGALVATIDKPTDSGWLDSAFDVAGLTVTPKRLNGVDVTLPSLTVTAEQLAALTVAQGGPVSGGVSTINTYIDRVEVNGSPELRATTDYAESYDYTTVTSDTAVFRTSNSNISYLDMFAYGGTQGGTGVLATLAGEFVGTQINSLYHYTTTDTDGTHTAANKLYSFNGTIPDPANPTVRFAADPNNADPTARTFFGANSMARKQDRLFVAGKDADPAILEYSAINDTTKWATADGGGALRPTPPGTGDETANMVLWKDMLIWAGRRTVSSLKTDGDPTEWTVAELTQSFGCVAGKTMVAIPNGVVFLSQNGVVAYGSIPGFGGDGEGFSNLSENIRGTLDRVNVAHRHKAVGEYFNGRYFISLPLDGSEVNNYTLVLKFANPDVKDSIPSWTLYDYGVASMLKTDSELLAGGYDGWVYKLETGDQDDVLDGSLTTKRRIAMRYETPLVGLSNTIKDYREIYIATDGNQGQDFTFTTSTDGTVDTPAVVYTTPGDNSVRRFPHRKRGNSVALKIDGSSSVNPATITDITVTYNERKR